MPLRLNTKHHSQPDGGWSYPIPEGPNLSSDKMGEPGLKELLGKIADYRRSNGLPAGDPEHDVAMRYATLTPWLVYESKESVVGEDESERWVHQIWKSFPLPLAETRERDDRFEQCLKCVHFAPLNEITFSQETVRRLVLLNPAKFRKDYGWCGLHKWIPGIAAQLRHPHKLSRQTAPTPECWLHFPTQ